MASANIVEYPINVSCDWTISCSRNIEKREKYFDKLSKSSEHVSLHQLSAASRLARDCIKELIIIRKE